MDSDGPITKRCRAIKERVEDVGRKLGVPEDLAARYVEIDTQQRLVDSLEAQHKENNTWRGMIRKAIAYLSGLLKAEE